MESIDLETKFETYGDISREDGVLTGKMSPDVKLVAKKVNEIVEWINSKKDQLL